MNLKCKQIVLHYLDVVGAFFFVSVVGKTGGCIRFVGKWQKLIIILNSGAPFAFVLGLINVPGFLGRKNPVRLVGI